MATGICAMAGGGIALLALWSWGAGVSDLLTFDPRQVPMAPSTALLLVFLAAALLALGRRPMPRTAVHLGYGAATFVGIAGLLVLARLWSGWSSPLEEWLAQDAARIDGIPVGQMSPLTGALFAVAAAALLLRLPPLERQPAAKGTGVLLALTVLGTGAAMVVSYAVGKPLLYDGTIIPMALPTAIAFLAVGLALLALPPSAGPAGQPPPLKSAPWPENAPWTMTFLLVLLVGAGGALLLRQEQAQRRAEAHMLLKSIGDLKAGQISRWRNEHWREAWLFFQTPHLGRDTQAFLADPESAAVRAVLRERLTLFKNGDHYALAALFDADFAPRLTLPERLPAPPVVDAGTRAELLRTRQPVMNDLHFDPATGRAHLDVMFPVFASDAPAGYVMLRLDPQRFLFTLIRSWPTPSRTAETLLVRREGREAVCLNELRQRTGTALKLRIPLDPQSRLPVVMAALGRTGQMEGIDDRGTPVLSAFCAVPDTPWSIVAQMDRAEIYAPMRRQAWLALALTAALAGMAGLIIRLILKQREARRIQGELAAAREIARLNKLYATLSQINQSIVRVTAREELFRKVCRIAAEYAGFKLVWVGWRDPATGEVVPVARAGDDAGYLDKVRITSGDEATGRGPVGTCLRENRPCIIRDFLADPRTVPWQAMARTHGLRSAAAIPLHLDGAVCGAFTVYAGELDVFREKEVELLEEIAMDISFAMDNLVRETRRRQIEEEREITVKLLGLLNAPTDLHELMRQVTLLLHEWFDCEAIGIRLRDGDDFPYFETRGFPAEFVRLENSLCLRDAANRPVRDAMDHPVLECMCGNVLCGRFDPSKPFFTARGSFWSNCTTELLARTTDADRQARTRNRCNGEGYESVALVALRAGQTIHGLLQANDKRRNRFTPERMALLERLADSLAIGIAHRQDQQRLRESEERYRQLFEGANDAITLNAMLPDGTPGRFVEVNDVICRRLGYSRKELLQKTPFDIQPDRGAQQHQAIARVLREHGVAVFETVEVARDGRHIPVEVNAHLFELHGQWFVLAIARDLTERKSMEAQLLRTQRLESVGRLASGIAHDLNNILAPMLMAPALLREEIRDPGLRDVLDTIETSARRGAGIIKQLLVFGRGLQGERIPVQLRTLVREMNGMIVATFPKNIVTRLRMPVELPLVTGDSTQLQQVLLNLCVNARDAMPEGGTLTLTLETAEVDAAAAAGQPGARPGRHVVLDVDDTGAGIAPEDMDRIFDPFFTTKAVGEGTGLGLSTALGIVRSHNGFIQVQSAPGQGARFRVYLPVSETAAATAADAGQPPLPQGHGERVLVVDDEEIVRTTVCRTLENNGYRVVEAQDGAEALHLLAETPNAARAVLTDLIMPRMDGLTLIRELRRQKSRVRILAMGGLPPAAETLGALGLTPQQFIAKPFTADTLLTALQALLAP